MMKHAVQMDVFPATAQPPAPREDFPPGFRYAPNVLAADEESQILDGIRALPFKEFDFHGYKGKRRVVSFGWQYDFSARQVRKTDDIPPFLLDIRVRAAEFAGLDPADLQHVLVTEYGPGAGIGWHRDKSVFDTIVGVSLLAPCVFRLRHKIGERRWERVSLIVEPRSMYVLSGTVRDEWEHSIPSVSALRYSLTFRNVRSE